MYLFLDESGNLGFDLTKTTRFFAMALLIVNNLHSVKAINLNISQTLKRMNKKQKVVKELKGTDTSIKIKKYFLDGITNSSWYLHSIIIDKKSFQIPKYIKHSSHLYNYIALNLFSQITIEKQQSAIVINVDKCKTKKEICIFNHQVKELFYHQLCTTNNLIINHKYSHDMKLLQAVDLFCYGLFSKYEYKDLAWYNCFRDRIRTEKKL
jgi:hypothetical protein